MRAVKGSTTRLVSDQFDDIPSSPTATAHRADGTLISPAPVATVEQTTVVVLLTAAAHLNQLDQLTVTITCTVDSLPVTTVELVDVIGSHMVSTGALRSEPDLDDQDKFPTPILVRTRDEWENRLEEWCNVRFTPGYTIETHRVCSKRLVLNTWEPRTLRSITVDGTAVDVTGWDPITDGIIDHPSGWFDGLVEVHLESGKTRPPSDLVTELRKAISREVKGRGARAQADVIWTANDGAVRYSTPDPAAGRFTGIISLDPIIVRERKPELGFA